MSTKKLVSAFSKNKEYQPFKQFGKALCSLFYRLSRNLFPLCRRRSRPWEELVHEQGRKLVFSAQVHCVLKVFFCLGGEAGDNV